MFQSGGTRPTSSTSTLFAWLREHDVFDARGYARAALRSRALDRIRARNFASVDDYVSTLESDVDERAELLSELLGSTSAFGVDAGVWRALANQLARSRALWSAGRKKFRVWSVGCATGEEPFTLAMILAEAFELDGLDRYVEILATDIDPGALAFARRATYDEASISRLPRATVAKYFDAEGGSWAIKEPLARVVRFERHDLLHDAPKAGMHLVVCRDLVGVLSTTGRKRATRQLVRALEPDGLLVLGRGEWPENEAQLETVDAVRSIHRRFDDGGDR